MRGDTRQPSSDEIARALLALWQASGGLLPVRDAVRLLTEQFGAAALTQPDGRLDLDLAVRREFQRLVGPRVVFDAGARAWRVDRRHLPPPVESD
jgi:hypothetical protein